MVCQPKLLFCLSLTLLSCKQPRSTNELKTELFIEQSTSQRFVGHVEVDVGAKPTRHILRFESIQGAPIEQPSWDPDAPTHEINARWTINETTMLLSIGGHSVPTHWLEELQGTVEPIGSGVLEAAANAIQGADPISSGLSMRLVRLAQAAAEYPFLDGLVRSRQGLRVAQSDNSYTQVIEVTKKGAFVSSESFLDAIEIGLLDSLDPSRPFDHSATIVRSYSESNGQLVKLIETANHGTPALDPKMRTVCLNYFPRRTSPLPPKPVGPKCTTNYPILTGILPPYHVCNNDSQLQVRWVAEDMEQDTEGSDCTSIKVFAPDCDLKSPDPVDAGIKTDLGPPDAGFPDAGSSTRLDLGVVDGGQEDTGPEVEWCVMNYSTVSRVGAQTSSVSEVENVYSGTTGCFSVQDNELNLSTPTATANNSTASFTSTIALEANTIRYNGGRIQITRNAGGVVTAASVRSEVMLHAPLPLPQSIRIKVLSGVECSTYDLSVGSQASVSSNLYFADASLSNFSCGPPFQPNYYSHRNRIRRAPLELMEEESYESNTGVMGTLLNPPSEIVFPASEGGCIFLLNSVDLGSSSFETADIDCKGLELEIIAEY